MESSGGKIEKRDCEEYFALAPLHSLALLPSQGTYQYTYGAADPLVLAFFVAIAIVVHDITREFIFEVREETYSLSLYLIQSLCAHLYFPCRK